MMLLRIRKHFQINRILCGQRVMAPGTMRSHWLRTRIQFQWHIHIPRIAATHHDTLTSRNDPTTRSTLSTRERFAALNLCLLP
jgi:hypothetical protein